VVGLGHPKDHTGTGGAVLARELFGHGRMRGAAETFRQVAWYCKTRPTFADALALVRKELWEQEETFWRSSADIDTVKVPRAFVERLTDAVCYAA
jgi:hypothetical protein